MKPFRFLLFALFNIIALSAFSQGQPLEEVNPVEIDGKNVLARTSPRVASSNKNGDSFCGLLILKSTVKNLSFPDAVGEVKFEDAKYFVYLKPKTKKVTVVSGKYKLKLKVEGGIEPKTTYSATVMEKGVLGSFSLKSKPVKVNVSLNGQSIGSTPLNNYKVYPGDYRLKLSYPGYVEEEIFVEIEPNKNKSLDVELLAAPDYGALYRKFRNN